MFMWLVETSPLSGPGASRRTPLLVINGSRTKISASLLVLVALVCGMVGIFLPHLDTTTSAAAAGSTCQAIIPTQEWLQWCQEISITASNSYFPHWSDPQESRCSSESSHLETAGCCIYPVVKMKQHQTRPYRFSMCSFSSAPGGTGFPS